MDEARLDNLRQQSDAELVRLLVAGNHDAMSVIFDRYYRLVILCFSYIMEHTESHTQSRRFTRFRLERLSSK
jgi:hypothetical protein